MDSSDAARWAATTSIASRTAWGNAHIVAIYDLNRAAAEKAVADFGLDAKICDSADELIHAPEVDAVVMASRNDAHLEPLLACIEAGKPSSPRSP